MGIIKSISGVQSKVITRQLVIGTVYSTYNGEFRYAESLEHYVEDFILPLLDKMIISGNACKNEHGDIILKFYTDKHDMFKKMDQISEILWDKYSISIDTPETISSKILMAINGWYKFNNIQLGLNNPDEPEIIINDNEPITIHLYKDSIALYTNNITLNTFVTTQDYDYVQSIVKALYERDYDPVYKSN